MKPLLTFTALACLAGSASAQTGVSDDRVSLPEGPGSLSGLGDDVSIDPNMGAMSYSVPIVVPAGHGGMAPTLALSYSSAAGASVVGMGWSMSVPSIERLTKRGVPEYLPTDEMTADGAELVHVDTLGGDQVYRARFESGFVRYTWKDVGVGTDGYWVAEYPDGSLGYFGADRNGAIVTSARVGDPDLGTFRYLLVDLVDAWGHRMTYGYTADSGADYDARAYLESIGWVYEGNAPTYTVAFSYGDRQDLIANLTGGFEDVLDRRLERITVAKAGTTIRTYVLTHDDYATSGGFTRLKAVQLLGVGNAAYPAATTFGYSQSLGGVCQNDSCEKPYVKSMGSIGTGLANGRATLVDMNGDALPDIVDTSIEGAPHRFFFNVPTPDGSTSWSDAVESAVGEEDAMRLGIPSVQVLDVNGDGFTDLVHTYNGDILYNLGGGDWDRMASVWDAGGGGLPDLTEASLTDLRFMDYDGDKKIDLVRSTGTGSNETTIWRNGGDGFVIDPNVEKIDMDFGAADVELNDFNGDGLLDVVRVDTTTVTYRLNLGWGRWTELRTAGSMSFTAAQARAVELEDMNGDGQSDLVLVSGTSVRVWINKNGSSFADPISVSDAMLSEGSLPDASEVGMTVLYADMNGNGSSDVVWVDKEGDTSYLELFPLRANLLSTIANGLGWVSEVTYGTSVRHMAQDVADGHPWTHKIPFPNVVVDQLDEHDTITNVHRITSYAYHEGFYDGVEKAFRGFEDVSEALTGDEAQEAGETKRVFDVGVDDPYRAGLLLEQEVLSGGRSLELMTQTFADCDVAGVPDSGLLFDVRYLCLTRSDIERREGADPSKWVTLRTDMEYDGYGNVTKSANLGVVAVGGSNDCGPCDGPEGAWGSGACGVGCLGDESYVETDYVVPGSDTKDAWILNAPFRMRTYGAPESDAFAEELTYYDGEDFAPLTLGTLERGTPTQVTHRKNALGEVVVTSRSRLDDDGNVVEEIDPLGTVGGDDHRRLWTYDASGLFVTSVEQLLSGPDGAYRLRREYRYDSVLDLPSLATGWRTYQDDEPLTDMVSTSFTYDAFGRTASIALPGDPANAPTHTYQYDLGSDISRIWTRSRSVRGGAQDVVSVQCVDGRGRDFQKRQRIADDQWLVDGYKVFTHNDAERAVFMPWTADSSECESSPPADVEAVTTKYDALMRPIESIEPGADDPKRTFTYEPLVVTQTTPTDNVAGALANTPTIRKMDGLGRLYAVGRVAAGNSTEWYRFGYDQLGRITHAVDPIGATREQSFDVLGRVSAAKDPDRGNLSYSWDDFGNRISRVDANGREIRSSYDAVGRVTATWQVGAESTTRNDFRYDFDWDGLCPESGCGQAGGQLVSVSWPVATGSASDVYIYDDRSQLVGRQRDFGGVVLDEADTLDNLGAVVQQRFPGGLELGITMDGAHRLGAIDGIIDAVGYDAHGDVASVTASNGVVTSYSYNESRDVTRIRAVRGDAVVMDDLYQRNVEGWITGVDDGRTTTHSRNATFGFDAFGRMTSAALADETLTFGYDGGDNFIARTSTVQASPENDGARLYDATRPHAVTKAGDLHVAYDASGYVSQRGDWTLSWDGLGRLLKTENGNDVVSHTYGRGFERVTTERDDGVTYYMDDRFEVEEGVASFYVSVGNASVARIEYPDLATTVLSDLNGDDAIDVADAWLATQVDDGSPVDHLLAASAALALVGEQRVTWLHRDALDTVVAVTDDRGAVVEESQRYPYGASRWSSSNAPEAYAFTDKKSDRDTGLVYVDSRWYDPQLGRWTAPDHAFETLDSEMLNEPAEALGAYSYVRNNPMGGQDENGALTRREKSQARNLILSLASCIESGNFRSVEETANQGPHQGKFGLQTDTKEEAAAALLDIWDSWKNELDELTKTDDVLSNTREAFEIVASDPNMHKKILYHARVSDNVGDLSDGSKNDYLKNQPPRPQLLRGPPGPYVPSVSLSQLSGKISQQTRDTEQQRALITNIAVQESLARGGLGGSDTVRQRSNGIGNKLMSKLRGLRAPSKKLPPSPKKN